MNEVHARLAGALRRLNVVARESDVVGSWEETNKVDDKRHDGGGWLHGYDGNCDCGESAKTVSSFVMVSFFIHLRV